MLFNAHTALRMLLALLVGLVTTVAWAQEATPSVEGSWRLVRIEGMDDSVWDAEPPSRYTLIIEDGEVWGRADCNVFQGTLEVQGSSLAFSPLATTRAFCHDAGMSDTYRRNLSEVRSFLASDHALFLATWADGAILTFVRGLPNARFIGACDDGSRVELVAARTWAGLKVNDRFRMLPRVISASGVRWADERYQAWNKGLELTLKDLTSGRSTVCQLASAEP